MVVVSLCSVPLTCVLPLPLPLPQDGWTPLHLSVWNGHTNVVHELITANCQVNLRVENNAGALHLAAAKGHDDIVQELLDAGIAPDMQTKVCGGSMHYPH